MAEVDYNDEEERRRNDDPVPPARDMPPPSQAPSQQSSPFDINADLARIGGGVAIEQEDRDKLARLAQQSSQNEDYSSYLKEIQAKQQRRAAPTFSNGGTGGDADRNGDGQLDPGFLQGIAGLQNAGRTNFDWMNQLFQFDDPYTKSLESLLQQQLQSLQQPQANPALDSLLGYLNTQFQQLSGPRPANPQQQQMLDFANQQFQNLSQNPGYTAQEQGIRRTQALEPIEQDRAAAQRRSLERTAARGFLPSSGLAELDSREVDMGYDRLRGAAQRDLAIDAMNRRDADLDRATQFATTGSAIQDQIRQEEDQRRAQALTLGQLSGVTIPGLQRAEDTARRNEAVALATLLYQLPRNAQMDALAVINGTPPAGDLFGNALQMLQMQEDRRLQNQQRNDAFWAQIGATLAGLFG